MLSDWRGDTEPVWKRRLYLACAILLAAAFFVATRVYWVPAHPGVDQNGYLVGGKQFARTLSTGMKTPDPYSYVGSMWIGADLDTPAERYYPKYPLGYPVLVAVTLWLGGAHGVEWTYSINPVCGALALIGLFVLVRQVLGSFWGLLAQIALAASPVLLALINKPDSHAGSLCCVVWGMALLLAWWRRGGYARGIAAAFLLGYAATIRYSEGMLIAPLALVVLYRLRLGWQANWRPAFATLVAWAVPVGGLLAFNLAAMGTPTGYDPTNESTGFSWEYFQDNWEPMLRQLETAGLFFLLPLALVGLMVLAARQARLALVLTAWVLPSVLLYTAYYWAPDSPGISVSYLRFFLTVLPGLILAALAGLASVSLNGRLACTLLPAAVVALSSAVGMRAGSVLIEDQQRQSLTAHVAGQTLRELAERKQISGAVVFCDQSNLLNHLQFVTDWRLYTPRGFEARSMDRFRNFDPSDPQGLHPQRRIVLTERLRKLGEKGLVEERQRIVREALERGDAVWMVTSRRPPAANRNVRSRGRTVAESVINFGNPSLLADGTMTARVIGSWSVPPVVRTADPRPRTRGRGVAGARFDGGSWQLVEVARKPPPTTQLKR